MKKFLTKMIIPTVILAWAIAYYVEVSKYKPINSVLIRPVFYVMAFLYVVKAVTDFTACRKEAAAASAGFTPEEIAAITQGTEGVVFRWRVLELWKRLFG